MYDLMKAYVSFLCTEHNIRMVDFFFLYFALVLPELPLPTPLPHTLNNKSLLFHQKVAEESRQVLATQDPALVSQLVNALKQTNTDHM